MNKVENGFVYKSDEIKKPEKPIGVRHVQYCLMFSSTVLAYGMRTILNVAIVAMIGESHGTYSTYPEWKSKKNIILSSFFWGYICLQVGAGQLAKKYGPKKFLFFALLLASLFTLLIPLFGQWFGYQGIIVSRVIQGLSQGFLLPSLHTLLSLWTHISERAKWCGIVYAGQALGNVFAMPIAGAICGSKMGWPLIFYLYGSLGILWCTCWIIFGSNSPSSDTSISKEEREWLESSNFEEQGSEQKSVTPWRAIFTSLPFLSIVLSHVGQNWGFWTLLTEIPSYMKDILNYNIAENSYITALPYLVMFLLNFLMSPLADLLIEKKIASLVLSRKIFNSIGFFIPGLALVYLGCAGSSNKTIVIATLVVAVGFNAGQYSGFNLNHIDLSPVHAGTLMAITNSLATISSILAPLAVDLVGTLSDLNETDEKLWNIVFFIAAGAYIATGCIFNIFGSGDIQSWNYAGQESDLRDAETSSQQKVKTKILRKISVSLAT